MRFETVEIRDTDSIVWPLEVGNLSPCEVDKFCQRHLIKLKKVFSCNVAVIPVRNLEDPVCTIIRKVK